LTLSRNARWGIASAKQIASEYASSPDAHPVDQTRMPSRELPFATIRGITFSRR
jgi:hypothetical protein